MTFIFIVSIIVTAFVFYNLGLDRARPNRKFVDFILRDLCETFAEEFYPNDPNGKYKISDRIARRSFEDLRRTIFNDRTN